MAVAQTNNGDSNVVEKYCYDDLESNCDTYGALYLGNEAMKYTTNEGAQGICPLGSHIPSDNDWKMLEMQLGMTQSEADAFSVFRGVDQGTQLIDGGSSNFNVLFAGLRTDSGQISSYQAMANLWSSTNQNGNGNILYGRSLFNGAPKVFRNAWTTNQGFSVRCLAN